MEGINDILKYSSHSCGGQQPSPSSSSSSSSSPTNQRNSACISTQTAWRRPSVGEACPQLPQVSLWRLHSCLILKTSLQTATTQRLVTCFLKDKPPKTPFEGVGERLALRGESKALFGFVFISQFFFKLVEGPQCQPLRNTRPRLPAR